MSGTDWLDRLALRFEHDPYGFVLLLYNGQVEALLAAGVDGLDADRIALRQAQQTFFRLTGYSLVEAARMLKVSDRTAKSDAAHVRDVWDAPRLLFSFSGRRLRRVPERLRVEARVTPTVPPARLRGRR
jgi:hypothetical protein